MVEVELSLRPPEPPEPPEPPDPLSLVLRPSREVRTLCRVTCTADAPG